MAIRDVGGGPKPAGGQPGGNVPAPLERGLADAGLMKAGGDARQAAQTLLSNLAMKGFSAPKRGDVAMQLAQALKGFQGQKGLEQTGRLDQPTVGALKDNGVIPQSQQDVQQKREKDAFDKGLPALRAGEQKRADQANLGSPDTNFLDALINQLGAGGHNEGTSATDVKGAAQAGEAQVQTNAQKVDAAKKAEAAQKKGSVDGKEHDLQTNQPQLEKGNQQGVRVSRGLASEKKATEKRKNDATQGKDGELGILDEEAEEDAIEGAGEDGKRRRGQGGEHDGAQDEGADTGADAGGPEENGSESWRGNATSGDQRANDARRGNASLDDGSGDGAGHHRVPTLSEQAFAALERIAKDDAIENRATTYSWDVTFYKPGVYGAGQKAQELVHLVVDKAAAFDPVWQKAQANLTALVKRLDPDGAVPTLEDILQAIRQARARDGGDASKGAAAAPKLTRPIGKA